MIKKNNNKNVVFCYFYASNDTISKRIIWLIFIIIKWQRFQKNISIGQFAYRKEWKLRWYNGYKKRSKIFFENWNVHLYLKIRMPCWNNPFFNIKINFNINSLTVFYKKIWCTVLSYFWMLFKRVQSLCFSIVLRWPKSKLI